MEPSPFTFSRSLLDPAGELGLNRAAMLCDADLLQACRDTLTGETDVVQQAILRSRIGDVLINSTSDSLSATDISRSLAEVPSDRLGSVISKLLTRSPQHMPAVLQYYWGEKSADTKLRAHQGLLAFAAHTDGQWPSLPCDAIGPLQSVLNIFQAGAQEPNGRRTKILTDFYTISQLLLRPIGVIRFLPLPKPMPRCRPFHAPIAEDSPMEAVDFLPELDLQYQGSFGRSLRFRAKYPHASTQAPPDGVIVAKRERSTPNSIPTTHPEAEDIANSQGALALLRYEVEVMDYFIQHRSAFGLTSFLPSPARGPNNSKPLWKYGVSHYLQYGTNEAYLTYLDEIPDYSDFRCALLRSVADLSRLARFGIFHLALAAPFHNREQGRPFLWDNGGRVNGAGRLDRWTEAFRYSNMRLSGIADFEHFKRFAKLAAVSGVVSDDCEPQHLGLQHHLGQIVFSSLHIAGLWFRTHMERDDWSPSLENCVEDILKTAHNCFTGLSWPTFAEDVDRGAIAREMERYMGARPGDLEFSAHDTKSPDLGAYGGEYPLVELIRGVTAFSIRAIHDFARNRNALREADQSSAPEPHPQFHEYLGSARSLSRETDDLLYHRLIPSLLESRFTKAFSAEQLALAAMELRIQDVLQMRLLPAQGAPIQVTLVRARSLANALAMVGVSDVSVERFGLPDALMRKSDTWIGRENCYCINEASLRQGRHQADPAPN